PSPPSLSSPIRLPPRPTPFPYTTLFRSGGITPSTHNLTLSVPAFLRATGGAPAATLHVDDLSLFRSGAALSSTTPIQLSSSLPRSEEHTSELQSRENLVCRLLLEKKKNN